MRATPPWARMSDGTRSSAMTETAPASSAIRACSAVTTSMITPPRSMSASPRLTVNVPVCRSRSELGSTTTDVLTWTVSWARPPWTSVYSRASPRPPGLAGRPRAHHSASEETRRRRRVELADHVPAHDVAARRVGQRHRPQPPRGARHAPAGERRRRARGAGPSAMSTSASRSPGGKRVTATARRSVRNSRPRPASAWTSPDTGKNDASGQQHGRRHRGRSDVGPLDVHELVGEHALETHRVERLATGPRSRRAPPPRSCGPAPAPGGSTRR